MKNRWLLLVGGIFSFVAGGYVFTRPAASLASMALFFSVILLVNGISEIIQFFTEKKVMFLLTGIITVLVALSLLSSTWLGLVALIPYMFAFWLLMNGIIKVVYSFKTRKTDRSAGNLLLFTGLIGAITAIFLFNHPLFTTVMVAYMVAFAFIYQGIANISLFFNVDKLGE